jgi:hypothetical protein
MHSFFEANARLYQDISPLKVPLYLYVFAHKCCVGKFVRIQAYIPARFVAL